MEIILLCNISEETEICTSGLRKAELVFYSGPLGIVLSVIELMMVCVFWTVNIRVDGSDFTKAYATTLMVPLSGSAVTKFWSVVNSVAGVHYDYTAYGQISYFIQNLYGALVTATELYVMMGTVGLILLLVVTALQQKRFDDMDSTWLGFITILLVAMTLGSLNHFVDPPYRGIPKFLTALVVVCASAALVVVLVTCSVAVYFSRRKCSSKDIVLTDAWNRMVFAKAASALALIPCCFSLWLFSVHYLTPATTSNDDARAEWLLRIVQFFTGLIVSPTVFLFKPYSSACVVIIKERKAKKGTSPVPLNLAPPLPPPPPPQLTYAPVAPFAKLRNLENGSA